MVSLHEMVSRLLMNWSMRNKMFTMLATTFLSCSLSWAYRQMVIWSLLSSLLAAM